MHYLWRAVDHEGEVLESFATKERDKRAALKFMKKLMKRHGCSKTITTGGLRSYGAAMKENLVSPTARRSGAVREQPRGKPRTSRFEDGSERCLGFGE